MAKFKYIGHGERVFPSLGLTVKSGQEFDAPDNFISANVVANGSTPKATPKVEPVKTLEPSEVSDSTVGE